MELVNTKEVKKLIDYHSEQIKKLESLLEFSSSAGSTKATAAGKAKGRAKAKPAGKRKGKRGAISGAIVETISSSSSPMTAGDVKTRLTDLGLIEKGSTTIYSMLQQMAKRGTLKKTSSAKGVVYSAASAPASKKKAKATKKPGKASK